ncbi:Uncharacterised protein [Yersinia bercovieri]|nr:Uncharacterised protein [Yersinia bercovieri]
MIRKIFYFLSDQLLGLISMVMFIFFIASFFIFDSWLEVVIYNFIALVIHWLMYHVLPQSGDNE